MCIDLDFTVTDYLGKSSVYLNVFPWSSDRTPWRHESERAYLEHLEAISQRLVTWDRVLAVLTQIDETDKARDALPSPPTFPPTFSQHSVALTSPAPHLALLLIPPAPQAPRRGTIPLKTVPLRLDLPNDLARSFRP